MPVSSAKAAAERAAQPNLMTRRQRTRKENKCQLCEAKVPIKDQFTVTNDLEAGEAVKRKNAGAKGKENASHYCGECATKRVTQKEAWMQTRDGSGSKPKGKGKKASKKGKGKAKGKKAVKKVVKKVGKGKGKSKSKAEAF